MGMKFDRLARMQTANRGIGLRPDRALSNWKPKGVQDEFAVLQLPTISLEADLITVDPGTYTQTPDTVGIGIYAQAPGQVGYDLVQSGSGTTWTVTSTYYGGKVRAFVQALKTGYPVVTNWTSDVNAYWSPDFIETTGWYDASDADTITASGGAVSQWDDKSGNNHHLVQPTGSKQPDTGLVTLNGKNVVSVTGTGHAMSKSFGTTISQGNAMVGVWRWGSTSRQFMIDSYTSTNRNIVTIETNFRIYAGTYLVSGTGDTNPHVFYHEFNGSSSQMWSDGTQIATGNANTQGSDGITIFAPAGEGPASSVDNGGYIAELIFLDTIPDSATQRKLEGYLAWKWGGDL